MVRVVENTPMKGRKKMNQNLGNGKHECLYSSIILENKISDNTSQYNND
jgi:hypothetical protein